MQLRPYQQRAVDYVRQKSGRFRLCLEAPTGAGKTVIMAELLNTLIVDSEGVARPMRQVVLTHRKILLEQTSRVLSSLGIEHGFIAAGRRPNPKAPIQLAMTQTITRRAGRIELPPCEWLHIDELHVQGGPVCRELFDTFVTRGASLIGYSATPANLSGVVNEVARVVTVPSLIKQGYLLPPRVFSCGQPDLKQLEKLRRDSSGEYLAGDVAKLVKPKIIFGSVVQHYRRLTNGTPFFLFAHSVKASIWWAQMLTAKGIPTAHIDGDDIWVDGSFYQSDHTKRKECFERLSNGDLAGVSNRFVLREGVDCPAVGHIIMTAPVGSRVSFVQQCGRGLRPHAGQEYAIIQDHAGSCLSHPPLTTVEPWDWQAPPGLAERRYISELRNDVAPEPIVCPKCMGQRLTGPVCPYCGFQYAKRCRYVYQLDGTLKLIEGKQYKPQQVTRRPDDAKVWERLYFGAAKNKPGRTFEQIRAYFAFKNNWRWLPRDLPLMPKSEGAWFLPVGKVPMSELR